MSHDENCETLNDRIRSAAKARSVSIKGYCSDVPGIFFRSRWEANYARYLNVLLAQGVIESWEHEPDTFWFEKIRRGVRSYKPDFRITERGHTYYVEIKGWMDKKSLTKLKRMRIYHPSVDLRLIDEKAYRLLEKEIGPTVPNWEFPAPRAKKPASPRKAAPRKKAVDAAGA